MKHTVVDSLKIELNKTIPHVMALSIVVYQIITIGSLISEASVEAIDTISIYSEIETDPSQSDTLLRYLSLHCILCNEVINI